MKSILIKDTTKEEREQIVKSSLDCGGVDSNVATYLINEAGYRSDIVYR